MKLTNISEDKYKRKEKPEGPPPFDSIRYSKPKKIQPSKEILHNARTAAIKIAADLRELGPSCLQYELSRIRDLLKVVKTNPKIAKILYRWLADYMSKVGHTFDVEDMEALKEAFAYLKS